MAQSPLLRRGGTLLLSWALTVLGRLSTAAGTVPPHQFVPLGGEFNEHVFRRKVSSALATVSRVLENTRSPRLAVDHEDHSYGDKYALTEFLANSALAASLNALDRLGLDESKLSELKSAVDQNKSVTLRFDATENCDFIEEKEVEIESPRQYETYETTEKGEVREEKKTRSKIVSKVKEYHWSLGLEYSVTAYGGSDPDDSKKMTLNSRRGSAKIVQGGSQTRPRPEVYTPPAKEVDLTWFLKQLNHNGDHNGDAQSTCHFSIDRDAKGCCTPRRNDEVREAENFFRSLRQWGDSVSNYFTRELRSRLMIGSRGRKPPEEPHDLIRVETMNDALFVPVLPLFEPRTDEVVDETKSTSPLLSVGDMELFLNEQCRSIDAKVNELVETFPASDSQDLISSAEASLVLVVKHCSTICEFFCDGIDSVESMLRSQLVRAIGKDLKPSDFDDFLRFYYNKLFKEPFVPEPFMYAIRRPHHYPDGTLSIESDSAGSEANSAGAPSSDPIVTTTRRVDIDGPMYLPISAATTIEFLGDRYLHAWVRHDFSGGSQSSAVNLVARARQFSSFMLVIGTISGPDSFSPQNAIILQNKDEVLIPLLLEQLPTPKEFKDAIESLSPEQKRFAKAFRDMQLSTSVFGVLVIQLKPQLESVLGLPEDSLTKEIRLTQDLLSLFMQYQIPSDLLSFDGSEDASVADKVARVKTHVTALKEMIEDAKKEELEEEQRKADMAERKKKSREDFGDDEIVEEESGGGIFARPVKRILRAQQQQAAHMQDRAVPQMMMAADVADDMVVSAAGVQEFGEMRMMATRAAPEGGAHLRAHQGAEESVPPQEGKIAEERAAASSPSSGHAFDFTQVPKQLDQSFEELDDAAALRPTKIKVGENWKKKYHVNLLTPLQTKSLGQDEQKTEKNRAFDLLDALSKSGALSLSYTELHVMVAATHRFDKSLVDTVIHSNVNPIEKVEKSLLIVSSTIHGLPVADLISDGKIEQVGRESPALLDFNKAEADETGDDARTE